MKLDSRILEGKKPLDCFDTEQAKEFLGKECYLSDGVASFANIDNLNKAMLMEVEDEDIHPYKLENTRWRYGSLFILPCEWVKPEEPEKKYRPFSYKEFCRLFDFGDGVCFRRKGQDTAEFSMFLGYEIDSDGNRDEIPGEGKVNLGGKRYTLAELFEYYEMQLDDEWQPFGVLDE